MLLDITKWPARWIACAVAVVIGWGGAVPFSDPGVFSIKYLKSAPYSCGVVKPTRRGEGKADIEVEVGAVWGGGSSRGKLTRVRDVDGGGSSLDDLPEHLEEWGVVDTVLERVCVCAHLGQEGRVAAARNLGRELHVFGQAPGELHRGHGPLPSIYDVIMMLSAAEGSSGQVGTGVGRAP